MCDQQSLRSACAYAQSDQNLCKSLEYLRIVKLLTEHHLEFLSLTSGCSGSSESTLVKMSNCWKSHAGAHMVYLFTRLMLWSGLQLKKYTLSPSSKKYAKQNLNVESISYKRVVQEGLRLKNFYTPRKLCLWWVYCFHVVRAIVRPCVRASVRPSVTFCFFNILKSHCWIFIKPCKHVHICKSNTFGKKVKAWVQFY